MADAPATKQDIIELRNELQAAAARLEAKIDALETRVIDLIGERITRPVKDIESRMMAAIRGPIQTMTVRLDGSAKRMNEFEERLMNVERRITALERRVGPPLQ